MASGVSGNDFWEFGNGNGNGYWIIPIPKSGNGKGMEKTQSQNSGAGREQKKTYSHNSGTGIRGFHSWEWTGTGIPAYP